MLQWGVRGAWGQDPTGAGRSSAAWGVGTPVWVCPPTSGCAIPPQCEMWTPFWYRPPPPFWVTALPSCGPPLWAVSRPPSVRCGRTFRSCHSPQHGLCAPTSRSVPLMECECPLPWIVLPPHFSHGTCPPHPHSMGHTFVSQYLLCILLWLSLPRVPA